jgi:hypothetical protein
MKKTIGLLILLLVVVATFNSNAYWSGALGSKHEDVANRVLNAPTMMYYKSALTAQGYSISSIVGTADSEPDPHRGWGYISNASNLNSLAMSNYNVGMILHAAADGSVGSKHEPAVLESDLAHEIWETTAEVLSMPSLNYDVDILHGSFDEKMDQVYAEQIAVAEDYADWWDDQIIPLPYDSDVETMISQGLDNSAEMGEAALKQFFDAKELVCKSWVLADWKFDEGGSQYAYTSKGSISADLRLGSSTSADSVDPAWSSAGYNGTKALYFNKYTSRGNVTNYARSVGDWTHYESSAVAPTGEFSIETIFKCSSLDHVSASDSDHPYCLYRYTDTNGSPQYGLYLVYTAEGKHAVQFNMSHADGTSTTLTFDADTAGLTMTTGVWYYVAVFYNGGALQIQLRDLAAGTQVFSASVTCPPLVGVSADPGPRFLVGSKFISTGPCFHGYIDRIRISTGRRSTSQRLYTTY